jgi:hypothetical protein
MQVAFNRWIMVKGRILDIYSSTARDVNVWIERD